MSAPRVAQVLRQQTAKIRELRAQIEAESQAAEVMANMLLLRLGGSVTFTDQDTIAATGYTFDMQEGSDGTMTLRAVPKEGQL